VPRDTPALAEALVLPTEELLAVVLLAAAKSRDWASSVTPCPALSWVPSRLVAPALALVILPPALMLDTTASLEDSDRFRESRE